jgi:exocyst complex protein 7
VAVAQLEDALWLLSDNCGLTAQWLADIVAYLQDGTARGDALSP